MKTEVCFGPWYCFHLISTIWLYSYLRNLFMYKRCKWVELIFELRVWWFKPAKLVDSFKVKSVVGKIWVIATGQNKRKETSSNRHDLADRLLKVFQLNLPLTSMFLTLNTKKEYNPTHNTDMPNSQPYIINIPVSPECSSQKSN